MTTAAITSSLSDLLEPSELRSPLVLSDPRVNLRGVDSPPHPHTRRLLDGLLVMTRPPPADQATLLRRGHDLDLLDCPRCHGRLRPLCVVGDRAQARRLLAHLARPHEFAPARDPTPDLVA